MRIIEDKGNLILEGQSDFALADIFDCGQCFRWEREGENSYFGIAGGHALLLEKDGERLIFHATERSLFESFWYGYFDLERDYSALKSELAKDSILAEAIGYGGGIRILKQEAFETLISFIISASNNIPRIKGIISRLCENFGEKGSYLGREYYSFPTAERLASLSLEELGVIRAGFRDKYILAAAKAVADGSFDLNSLYGLTAEDAKTELLKLYGVGNKVADCILLFGLAKTDSFPVDVWIKRIMEHCYFDGTDQKKQVISEYARTHFSPYGGFAQQYLFFWARENKIGV